MSQAVILLIKALQAARLANELVGELKPAVDKLLLRGEASVEEQAALREAYENYRASSPAAMAAEHWQVQPDPPAPGEPS